jgi:predicted nucleotidyltransferase
MVIPKMGKVKIVRKTSLADALFTATQQRVLALLFSHPARNFHAAELIRRARVGSGAVQRELARLEASGLITGRRIGSQKHYQANIASPLFQELRSIVQKTVGLAEPLRKALGSFAPKIAGAFVYGSVARGTDTAQSDVDLMIISDHLTYADVFGVLEAASKTLGRRINPTVYSPKEFEKRLNERNAFVTRVLKLPKLWLIGSEHDIVSA